MSAPDERPLGAGGVVTSTGHNENSGVDRDHEIKGGEASSSRQWLATRVEDQHGGCGRPFGVTPTWRRPTAALLIVGGLLLAALAGFCFVPGRDERRWPAAGLDRVARAWPLTAAAVGAAVLLAGWPGLGASVAAIVLVTVLRRRRVAAAGVGAVAVGAAVLFAVAKPWAGLDSWSGSLATPQLLALAGVSAMAAVGLRRPTFLRRMKGSSTTR